MIRPSGHQKALTLIVIVYIIAGLGILALSMSFRSRTAIKEAQLLVKRFQQDQFAIAACEQACSILEADDPNVDYFGETWFGWHELLPVEIVDRSDAKGEGLWQVTWRLVDESSKINVNLASLELLLGLDCLDEATVASVLDWIDQDDVPNPDGAEDDYYRNLEPAYDCKNESIDNIEELLLIKGVTPEIYYGLNLEEEDSYTTETSINSVEFAEEEDSQNNPAGLCDILTVYGDGRININTTSKQVLDATPFLSDTAISEIIYTQQSVTSKLSSIDDIRNSDNFTAIDKIVLEQIAKFNSNHFQLLVRIREKESPFWIEYVAIIERQGQDTRVLSWQRKSRAVLKETVHFLPQLSTKVYANMDQNNGSESY